MKETTIILIIAAVVVLAAVIALIAVISHGARERHRLVREYEDAKDGLQERLMTLSSEKAAVESLLSARTEYEERLKTEQENALKLQKEQHEKELAGMKDAFKALSAETSASFKSQSADSISELLKPIKEKFDEFDRSVRESQKESAAQSAAMKENIENVLKHSRAVGDEARNLANALTGYSKESSRTAADMR